jgi:hypothetical protein
MPSDEAQGPLPAAIDDLIASTAAVVAAHDAARAKREAEPAPADEPDIEALLADIGESEPASADQDRAPQVDKKVTGCRLLAEIVADHMHGKGEGAPYKDVLDKKVTRRVRKSPARDSETLEILRHSGGHRATHRVEYLDYC